MDQDPRPTAIGPNYNIQILNDIFAEGSHFNVKSIIANTQRHEFSDLFFIALFGNIRSEAIKFEKDTDGNLRSKFRKSSSDVDPNRCLIGMTIVEEALAKKIIKQEWETKFRNTLSPTSLCPAGWINTESEIDMSLVKDFDPGKVNGVVVEVKPPQNEIEYVKILFNFRKFGRYLNDISDKLLDAPLAFNNAKNESFYFLYGAFSSNGRMWWIPTEGIHWIKDKKCGTGDWVRLPTRDAKIILYENTSKQIRAYNYPLLVRLLGTPFSVAADIITSPIQVLIWRRY